MDTVTWQLGEAGVEDLEDVRRLLSAANEQYAEVLTASAFDAYMAMVLDLEPRLAVSQILLLREGPRPVATVTFFPDARDEGWGGRPGVAGIRSMGVDPGARARGLGATLVGECVRRAVAAGAHTLALHTADWLPAAIRLYERSGFVRDPDRDMQAVDLLDIAPADDFTALAFRLDLTARPAVR